MHNTLGSCESQLQVSCGRITAKLNHQEKEVYLNRSRKKLSMTREPSLEASPRRSLIGSGQGLAFDQ